MHEYLGMKLDYCEQGKVKIDIADYQKKILDDLPDKYQGRAITPTANHLFEVNETARKLSKKDAQAFHTIVENFLFLYKQARLDILTEVVFLALQVRKSDEDDDKELMCILKYLSDTRDLELTLESYGTGTVNWWLNAAFLVHHDMKSPRAG